MWQRLDSARLSTQCTKDFEYNLIGQEVNRQHVCSVVWRPEILLAWKTLLRTQPLVLVGAEAGAASGLATKRDAY